MTHDELLEKIRLKFFVNEEGATGSGYKESQLRNAVYAVVELHKPVMQWSGGYDGEDNPIYAEQCSDCSNNGFTQEYPCSTIQAIEKELSNG